MKDKTINLSKEEMFEAFKLGVKEAILEMTESGDGYSGPIRTEQFFKAITEGVGDGVFGIANSGTYRPGSLSDRFFDSIKEGVENAMEFTQKQ